MAVNQGVGTPTGAGRAIYKGVVVDVVVPGASVSDAVELINRNKLNGAPENSCIVQLYDASTVPSQGIVTYPFFPPHLQVPIKPGEIVWVISPTIDAPQPDECFWVCKIETGAVSSDVNFSHPFRDITITENSETSNARAKVASDSGQPLTNPPQLPGF